MIVTAAGGGIVASAWTAEVLTGLETFLKRDFTDNLWAISAVSGGSLGTYYYMLDFDRAASQQTSMQRIRGALRSSSLTATAWGSAGPDIWRFVWQPPHDRATALEQAWKNAWLRQTPEMQKFSWPMMREWREKVAAGEFPIVFFNATTVQSGSPFLFTPVDVRPSQPGNHDGEAPGDSDVGQTLSGFFVDRPPAPPFAGFGNFVEDYHGYDVDCATAAHLSATFPWVTPVGAAPPMSMIELPWTRHAHGRWWLLR